MSVYASRGAIPLPCLNSNISTELPSETLSEPLNSDTDSQLLDNLKLAKLSTQHRKSAFVLQESVHNLGERFGLENLGFLTLTFAQNIKCPKEAQRRLNSLISNVIKTRYQEYLGVFERQKSGRIHYHFLVVLNFDIRTGVDFDELAAGKYSSAGKPLRSEWSFWRNTAKKYGFGRTELLPIKTTAEAMAKYVGKYISKHMEVRNAEDKGVRLVRYSRGARAGTTRFMFHSPGANEWRRKVEKFAQIVQAKHPERKITELSDLSAVLGKRWAFNHRDYILGIPLDDSSQGARSSPAGYLIELPESAHPIQPLRSNPTDVDNLCLTQ